MDNSKVVAVVTAYNSCQYVGKAIASLLRQNFPALRKIVIDDHSSDGTAEVAESNQREVQIIKNERNLGFAHNLNQALSLADDEHFLFVLQDDVELIDEDYVSRGLKHFDDDRVAVVCGQPVGFGPDRLSLAKRVYARQLNLDYQQEGVKQISYSLLKADLMRVSALREVGGFSFAGNPKLGVEDQIIAKRLKDRSYVLVKDASLRYQLEFARRETLFDLLRSEMDAGKTLGVAVANGQISVNPVRSAETRRKRNHRRRQLLASTLFSLSLLLSVYSLGVGLSLTVIVLALESATYIRDSTGFRGREKLYFAAVGLASDVAFSFNFCLGLASRLRGRTEV